MSSSVRKCLVAICHNGPVVYQKTAQSLMELGWGNRVEEAKTAHGFEAIDFAWFTTFPRVDALRDSAMDAARQWGYTHVLFLDADMIWPTDVLSKMLAHHADGIVSGLYVLRHPPYAPVAMADKFREEGSTVDQFFHVELATTDLIACDVVGMGCALIPVDVLDKIGPRPWFVYQDDDHGWPRVTEDVPFCTKAKAAGVPIWLDPTISCGHLSADVKDVRHHKRYLQAKQDTLSAMPFKIIRSDAEDAA